MAYSSSILNSVTSAVEAVPTGETVISIDTSTRTINVPKSMVKVGVEDDQKSETYYFSIDRYFDNKDFTQADCKIRFVNANNEYGEDDVIDISYDDETITFGWLITNYATRYAGTLQFTVQFEISGGTTYQWQTQVAKLTVMNGINTNAIVIDPTSDVYKRIETQIQALQEQLSALSNVTTDIADLQTKVSKLETDVDYLNHNAIIALNE